MRGRSSKRRWALLSVVAVSTAAWTLGCPQPPKPRPRQGDPRVRARPPTRPRVPAPPAPKGPNIAGQVMFSLQVDSLDRLDKRILALLPPLLARGAGGKALARLLPGLARDVELNVLALDALDTNRPAAFGVLVKADRRGGVQPQLIAVLPIKGDGKLVVDGIKASYEECTEAPWGGLEIKHGGDTVTWVTLRKGWAVVAPTGPLLDSAHRYLVPLTRSLPKGGVRAQLKYKELLRLVKPLITKQWRSLKRYSGFFGSGISTLLAKHLPLIERIGEYLESIDAATLELGAGGQDWHWKARVKTIKGGLLAKWLARQQKPGTFGLTVLPPGAFLAANDWSAPEIRSLTHRLLEDYIQLKLSGLSDRLPKQVTQRGLFKKKRLTLAGYRRALRDLNLKDYKASYRVYRVALLAGRFAQHLKKTLPLLIKNATGKAAGALYATAGPGIGIAMVEEIKNARRHERDFKNAAWGALRSLNRLIREAWKIAPADLKKLLGKRPPLSFVYNPTALRVGLVKVSTLGLRIKWPKPPRGRQATGAVASGHKMLATYRQILETVLGQGDLVYAWAYAGKHHLSSAGKGWKARIKTMIRRATTTRGSSATTDKLWGAALGAGQGDRLTLLLFSATRLTTALLQAMGRFAPRMTQSKIYKMLSGFLGQAARSTTRATFLKVSRNRGSYVISSRIPNEDLKSILLLGAYFSSDTVMPTAAKGSSSGASPLHKRKLPPTTP